MEEDTRLRREKKVKPPSQREVDYLPLTSATSRRPGTHARHREDGRTGRSVQVGGDRVVRASTSRTPSSSLSHASPWRLSSLARSLAQMIIDIAHMRAHTRGMERGNLMVGVGCSGGGLLKAVYGARGWMYIQHPCERYTKRRLYYGGSWMYTKGARYAELMKYQNIYKNEILGIYNWVACKYIKEACIRKGGCE